MSTHIYSPTIDKPPKATVRSKLLLSADSDRKEDGGLRTKGYFKKALPDKPLVTVITVVFNGETHLEETILSVINQTYDNVEYIIIDGRSTDATIDIINKYEGQIDYWVSAPDRGIYDAMNKGIRAARGVWVNFMNCGDSFHNENVIRDIITKYSDVGHDVIYSDTLLINRINGKKILHKCNHSKLILIHQSMFYKKKLHDLHGLYLVADHVTISDYIFFSLLDKGAFFKSEGVIANYDIGGISNDKWAVEQKFIIDYLINKMPKLKFILYFLFYNYKRLLLQYL